MIDDAVGTFAWLFTGLADGWSWADLVVGGLLITGPLIALGLPRCTVSSNTVDDHPDRRWHLYDCGIPGLVVFVIALFCLRSPPRPA